MKYYTKDRPSRNQTFLDMALIMAKRSTCARGQNGALIVKGSRIVSSGYNGPIKDQLHCNDQDCDINLPCTRAIHAEANAIYFAARMGIPTDEAEIFCTTAPCKKCAEAIVQAGIKKIIFSVHYTDNQGLELLGKAGVEVERLLMKNQNIDKEFPDEK